MPWSKEKRNNFLSLSLSGTVLGTLKSLQYLLWRKYYYSKFSVAETEAQRIKVTYSSFHSWNRIGIQFHPNSKPNFFTTCQIFVLAHTKSKVGGLPSSPSKLETRLPKVCQRTHPVLKQPPECWLTHTTNPETLEYFGQKHGCSESHSRSSKCSQLVQIFYSRQSEKHQVIVTYMRHILWNHLWPKINSKYMKIYCGSQCRKPPRKVKTAWSESFHSLSVTVIGWTTF